MFPECQLVALLREIVASSKLERRGLCFAAQSALAMVENMNSSPMTPTDITCLADLINEFAREGYGEALAYIDAGMPDCEICTALHRHLQPAAGR